MTTSTAEVPGHTGAVDDDALSSQIPDSATRRPACLLHLRQATCPSETGKGGRAVVRSSGWVVLTEPVGGGREGGNEGGGDLGRGGSIAPAVCLGTATHASLHVAADLSPIPPSMRMSNDDATPLCTGWGSQQGLAEWGAVEGEMCPRLGKRRQGGETRSAD